VLEEMQRQQEPHPKSTLSVLPRLHWPKAPAVVLEEAGLQERVLLEPQVRVRLA
jgi:hypothetical protein